MTQGEKISSMKAGHPVRHLRRQLIHLLDKARAQYGLQPAPPRIAAALTHDFLTLLREDPRHHHIGLHWRLVSHARLHRHVICIRCPDQAFYLDAIKGYFLRRNIQPLEQHVIIARLEENGGEYTLKRGVADHQNDNFMFITLHLSATLLPDGERLTRDLKAVLHAVELSVKDFPAMHDAVEACAQKLKPDAPEAAALLRWMNRDKYIFHGMQVNGKKLGLLRNRQTTERIVKGAGKEFGGLPQPDKAGVEWLQLHATQHHFYSTVNMECVRICWHEKGGLASLVLIGHFSRSARHANASHIPLLRNYWKKLLAQPLLKQSAFYRREIRTIFDRLPKPLLLSIPIQELLEPMVAISNLTGATQTHTALFRPGPDGMYLLLAAIPADRFGPNVLHGIFRRLREIGIVEHAYQSFGIGGHRLLLIACTCEETKIRQNLKKAAEAIQESVLFWKDAAKAEILKRAHQLDLPAALAELEQIPFLYQNLFPPERLIDHMKARDWVLAHDRIHVRARNFDDGVELDIFSPAPLPLGELVATVQGFGLIAQQEEVVELERDGRKAHLSNLRCTTQRPPQPEDIGRLMLGLDRVLNREADDEAANALVLAAGLDIQQVTIVIALRNHLVQLLSDAAPTPLTNMLCHHPATTAKLYRLFEARHRPTMPLSYEARAEQEFEKALEQVQNLTDDRWFRALAELVKASLRTNAYARNPWEPVAIKIDPHRLSYAPRPLPYREIFVHGVHVEGVHLRGGPIARGGLRFSDRTADYRTEVLELMATQVTKNSLIVPTGAKGGFIVRRGKQQEPFVRQQYRLFIRALLSLTDNMIEGELVPPAGMRIPDEDANDPYLVVAADKGTARYSDFANEEAQQAGFWLDDAFASGGRHGYDHKAVGITARGAWVCAAYHLHTLGTDAWRDPISCVAIGDMSGDVFGNGMLLNPNIRLLGAFNHKHIFLDPDPDTARAYAERRRLFENTLGWDHYDPACISKGGGVFERSAKRIALSGKVRLALGIDATALSGEALIRALLSAPVDLLYNGGIGTYFKASGETDRAVRDPANNAVRVTADQLRCRVVCEGGNLGFTQRGRLQYAEGGGLINTDAIDNSAGVDMSDHEVNLKILFASMTPRLPLHRRNRILKELTEAVTAQCLDDNLAQSRALSLAEMEIDVHAPRIRRLRDRLIDEGRIDPETDARMDDTGTLGLRPQLAVLIGHEKNRVHDLLSGCREQPACFRQTLLHTYFPARIRRRFATAIDAHPLADDIVHTMAANHILNHIGLGALHHLETILDKPVQEIVPALLMAEFIIDADPLRQAIWQETREANTALEMQRSLQEHLLWFVEDLLRLCPIGKIDLEWMTRKRADLRRFRHTLDSHGTEGVYGTRMKNAAQAGITPKHAAHFAAIPELTQTAVALHLSDRIDQPMRRCLNANRACLQLLPLGEAEAALRSPAWDEPEVYELRSEWLHKLILLESRAVERIATSGSRNLLAAGESSWSPHRHWRSVQELRQRLAEDEVDRMNLLLLLTRLESLIEES